VSIFDKLTINVTSCCELEEEIDEEDDRRVNSLEQTNKTLAALEAIPCNTPIAHVWLFIQFLFIALTRIDKPDS